LIQTLPIHEGCTDPGFLQCEAARRSVGRQYILITPNAIEGRTQLGKDVTIIRYAEDLSHIAVSLLPFAAIGTDSRAG